MAFTFSPLRRLFGPYGKRAFLNVLEVFTASDFKVLTAREVYGDVPPGSRILQIQHDVVRDLEQAQEHATVLAECGLRVTFGVTPGERYYGGFGEQGFDHHPALFAMCRDIQACGHEIQIKNNFGSLALRHGVSAGDLLARELDAFRAAGVDIFGTSNRNDPLCVEWSFLNLEIFEGRCWGVKGGKRSVADNESGSGLRLGEISLESLGLQYEGWDYPRDLVVGDAGGKLTAVRSTRGRAGLPRSEMLGIPFRAFATVETHSNQWDFANVNAGPGAAQRRLKRLDVTPENLRELGEPAPSVDNPYVWPIPGRRTPCKAPATYRDELNALLYGAAPMPLSRRQDEFNAFMLARPQSDLLVDAAAKNAARFLEKARDRDSELGPVFAWFFSHINHAMVVAFEATGDERLLIQLIDHAEALLSHRDDVLGRKDDVRGRCMPAWGSSRIVKGKYSTNVTLTGRIAYPMLRTVLAARKFPQLNDKYADQLRRVRDAMEESVSAFDDEFDVLASGACYRRAHYGDAEPFNHSHCIGNALLMLHQLTPNSEIEERLKALADCFREHWFANGDGTVSWCYQPGTDDASSSVPERTWKATITTQFPLMAHEAGVAFTSSDIEKIAETFLVNVLRHPNGYNSRIGPVSEPLLRYPERKGGFACLFPWWRYGRYDQRVKDELENVACVPEIGDWFRHPQSMIGYSERLKMEREAQ